MVSKYRGYGTALQGQISCVSLNNPIHCILFNPPKVLSRVIEGYVNGIQNPSFPKHLRKDSIPTSEVHNRVLKAYPGACIFFHLNRMEQSFPQFPVIVLGGNPKAICKKR